MPELVWLKLPNDVGALEISTNNPRLNFLGCGTGLTSLNVSNAHELVYLDCSNNSLGALGVSHNPRLEVLSCASCGLSSLDISCNPALLSLYATENAIGNAPGQGCTIDAIFANLNSFGLTNGTVNIDGGLNAPPRGGGDSPCELPSNQNIVHLETRSWVLEYNYPTH
jgi:hypothetical protein